MFTVGIYAVLAGFIGLIPLSSPVLIILEVVMVYHLSVKNERPFNLTELGIIIGLLVAVGGTLQVLVGTAIDTIPGVGWLLKATLAFTFVLIFGFGINSYYQSEKWRSR